MVKQLVNGGVFVTERPVRIPRKSHACRQPFVRERVHLVGVVIVQRLIRPLVIARKCRDVIALAMIGFALQQRKIANLVEIVKLVLKLLPRDYRQLRRQSLHAAFVIAEYAQRMPLVSAQRLKRVHPLLKIAAGRRKIGGMLALFKADIHRVAHTGDLGAEMPSPQHNVGKGVFAAA